MSAVVVVGAQWGDEGKGKIVDLFTERAKLVVRYAGGPNAGHTLVVGDEKVIVRLVPSGILRPETRCVLAQGMVIDPDRLLGEIDELIARKKLDDKTLATRLTVSDRAHAIFPYHVAIDTLREGATDGKIGTTKRGVGPCYEDKAARRGIPLGALRDLGRTEKLIAAAIEAWMPIAKSLGGELPTVADVMALVKRVRSRILPLLAETSIIANEALAAGDDVLFEGAQGTLLDIDHGTYPFVTSSSPTAGGACTGSGVGPTRIDRVIGLVKAYTTRVGGGPFPTELNDVIGDQLRNAGQEFGSVTGRPRRTGWLDLPGLRYAVRVNGIDGVALTKLDVLSGLDEIKLCVGYQTPSGITAEFPIDDLAHATPIYESMKGWKETLSHAKKLTDLPDAARAYLDRIAQEIGAPLDVVSVGSRRDETIVLRHPFEKTAVS
ncbi:MAG: adenylosuccinate synthase [Polyangiaceae bacterium]